MRKPFLYFVPVIFLIVATGCKKEGCTDPLAENYDSNVKGKNDDGSCTYSAPAPIITVNIASDIVGTWNEAQHLINGVDYTQSTRTISFFSGNTYSTNQFTYPWHCEPGAAVSDYGSWSFDSNSSQLTLTSTKPQESHSYNVIVGQITSYTTNEMIFEFTSNSCSTQAVKLTFHR